MNFSVCCFLCRRQELDDQLAEVRTDAAMAAARTSALESAAQVGRAVLGKA
jgi:hypothetical protein